MPMSPFQGYFAVCMYSGMHSLMREYGPLYTQSFHSIPLAPWISMDSGGLTCTLQHQGPFRTASARRPDANQRLRKLWLTRLARELRRPPGCEVDGA